MNAKEYIMVERINTSTRYFLKKAYFFANEETIVMCAYIVEETKVIEKPFNTEDIDFEILKDNLQEVSVHSLSDEFIEQIKQAKERTLTSEFLISKDLAYQLRDKNCNLIEIKSEDLLRLMND